MTEPELWEKLNGACIDIFKNVPRCHDYQHTLRVLRNAEFLLLKEPPCNAFLVRTGALLHDIARPEELASGGKLDHAALGAVKAAELLHAAGCSDEPFIASVSEIVRCHRFRGSAIPSTAEARIVYDADKLDSLGAFGIARAFHFAGRIGACLHNTGEEALNSSAYSANDSAYREYLVKLKHLPEKMLTDTGRQLGCRRVAFMDAFFEKLNEEADLSIDPGHVF